MTLDSPVFKVRVSGDYACFTRPEMKVERVSYEVITPSAARGILEAILWKPAIRWVVTRIHVCKPIQWIGFKRNEVTEKVSFRNLQAALAGTAHLKPLVVGDHRAQRHTLALRDVAYVIEAGFRMTERAGAEDNPLKFKEMFERRMERGQWFRAPYLGCREFQANVEVQAEPFTQIADTRDLGWMLHDLEFKEGEGYRAHFFHAEMRAGVIEVPELRPEAAVVGGAQ
jgi:CRISPR-associated protein Cas5d